MKKLLLLLTFLSLLAGIETNYAEARQGSNVQYIHHRHDGGIQFGFDRNGFYYGFGPNYGFRNYGWNRNWNYRYNHHRWDRGWNHRYNDHRWDRGWNYRYTPVNPYFYYGPRAYNNQFAPWHFERHWHY